MRKIHHTNLLQKIFLCLIYLLLRLWYCTLRLHFTQGSQRTLNQYLDKPCNIYFWHNCLFFAPKLHLRCKRHNKPIYGLISASKDGALLETLVSYFGVRVIRGSSSWRGQLALKELSQKIEDENCDIIITPDGPRGPRYVCKPGSLRLACNKQVPVIFLSLKMNAWKLNSWDHFRIPKPFSKVIVHATSCEKMPVLSDEQLIHFANEQLNQVH